MNEIEINGETYIKKASAPTGTRAVVVIDRGWIYAGDVTEKDGRIRLSRAVWVVRWESIGFDGVLANPKKAVLKIMPTDVDLPADAELYRCPVTDNWGL